MVGLVDCSIINRNVSLYNHKFVSNTINYKEVQSKINDCFLHLIDDDIKFEFLFNHSNSIYYKFNFHRFVSNYIHKFKYNKIKIPRKIKKKLPKIIQDPTEEAIKEFIKAFDDCVFRFNNELNGSFEICLIKDLKKHKFYSKDKFGSMLLLDHNMDKILKESYFSPYQQFDLNELVNKYIFYIKIS